MWLLFFRFELANDLLKYHNKRSAMMSMSITATKDRNGVDARSAPMPQLGWFLQHRHLGSMNGLWWVNSTLYWSFRL